MVSIIEGRLNMKKKIGLVGYFGWGNFGDELFLKAHHEHLGQDFELEIVHDLLCEPYFSKPIEEVVKKYDAFLIGGGDLLNPVRVSPLYWQMEYLKKPVFVYGLGVPNVKWNRANVLDKYRSFFQHPNCKLVVPRDIESYNWIKENIQPTGHLEWFPDPVCAMARPQPIPPEKKTFGVVMRKHRSLSEDLAHVRVMIDKAKEMDYHIKHIVLGNNDIGSGDYEMAQSIAKEGEEIFYSTSLDEMCQALSSCSLLASIKFHGMIVAAMYGVPSIAMSVTPKNRNFLRMLERTEMLVSYTNVDLFKRVSYFPAKIPNPVRYKLSKAAKAGYARLKDTMLTQIS